MFNEEQKKALAGKLDPKHVKTKPGSGNYPYIEGKHAIEEANRVFGFDGWCRRTTLLAQVHSGKIKNAKGYEQDHAIWRAEVEVTVFRDDDNHIIRTGCGFGDGQGMLAAAHEKAMKEAETDAMKRALSTFGNVFGLALYGKEKYGVGTDQPEGQQQKPQQRQQGAQNGQQKPPAQKPPQTKPPQDPPHKRFLKRCGELKNQLDGMDVEIWGLVMEAMGINSPRDVAEGDREMMRKVVSELEAQIEQLQAEASEG